MGKKSLLKDKIVLIVDDEPDILNTLEDLLLMCETQKAFSFKEAANFLESRYYDIAILDIMGVDGYQLLEIAKERKVLPVMLTAHALTPENIIRSYKQGAAYFLPKDEMANIVTHLEEILDRKEKGQNPWTRWVERFANYSWEKKFGPDWADKKEDFWKNFTFYDA